MHSGKNMFIYLVSYCLYTFDGKGHTHTRQITFGPVLDAMWNVGATNAPPQLIVISFDTSSTQDGNPKPRPKTQVGAVAAPGGAYWYGQVNARERLTN
jgi:hypothetical protein